MRIPPADVISSWPTPNYTNPHTRGQALIITNVVFMVLITFAVVLRYYTRLTSHRKLYLDDVLIGIALILSLGLGAIVILANVRYGWNRHLWDVPITLYTNASIMAFTAKLVFVLAATLTRVSLICFYLRLVCDSGHEHFEWALRASMAWQLATCVAFVSLGIFLCNPVDSYWNLSKVLTGKCLDEGVATLVVGIVNCVSDLMVTVLPIPIIMRLRLPLRQRIGVILLLGAGVIVTIAGIIRTVFIWKALINTYEETWYSYPLWICAAVEIDLAVLCACAPALKPFFRSIIEKLNFVARSVRRWLPPSMFSLFRGRRSSDRPSTSSPHDSKFSSPKQSVKPKLTCAPANMPNHQPSPTISLFRTANHGSAEAMVHPQKSHNNRISWAQRAGSLIHLPTRSRSFSTTSSQDAILAEDINGEGTELRQLEPTFQHRRAAIAFPNPVHSHPNLQNAYAPPNWDRHWMEKQKARSLPASRDGSRKIEKHNAAEHFQRAFAAAFARTAKTHDYVSSWVDDIELAPRLSQAYDRGEARGISLAARADEHRENWERYQQDKREEERQAKQELATTTQRDETEADQRTKEQHERQDSVWPREGEARDIDVAKWMGTVTSPRHLENGHKTDGDVRGMEEVGEDLRGTEEWPLCVETERRLRQQGVVSWRRISDIRVETARMINVRFGPGRGMLNCTPR